MGVPWERCVIYHRWAGAATFVFGCLHMCTEYVEWVAYGSWHNFRLNLLDYSASHAGRDIIPWAVPLIEICFYASLVAAACSHKSVRRRCYVVFYALHALVLPLFVVATLVHSWNAWQFSLVAIRATHDI